MTHARMRALPRPRRPISLPKRQTNHLPQLVCLANSRSPARGPADVDHPASDRRPDPRTTTDGAEDGSAREPAASLVESAGHGGEGGGEGEAGLVDDGYKRTVGAGVTVVEKNEECDILDGVRLDEGQVILVLLAIVFVIGIRKARAREI